MWMSKQQLIEDNMGLVYYIINKHYPTYIHDEDVIQEGMLGLCKAISSYDPSKSKLSTFATVCILHQIRQYFRDNAKHSGVLSYEKVVAKVEDDSITFLDTLASCNDVDLGCISFKMFYDQLSERDQQIIDLSLDNTVNEIAQILGMSPEYVSRKRNAIKRKWRKFNGND